ncbi:unnamed protein product [Amoebophrya sp. A25]|nr:unnamed protein product [Amoebophrya sp. A25]|eukprot:GSA25T00016578001.1
MMINTTPRRSSPVRRFPLAVGPHPHESQRFPVPPKNAANEAEAVSIVIGAHVGKGMRLGGAREEPETLEVADIHLKPLPTATLQNHQDSLFIQHSFVVDKERRLEDAAINRLARDVDGKRASVVYVKQRRNSRKTPRERREARESSPQFCENALSSSLYPMQFPSVGPDQHEQHDLCLPMTMASPCHQVDSTTTPTSCIGQVVRSPATGCIGVKTPSGVFVPTEAPATPASNTMQEQQRGVPMPSGNHTRVEYQDGGAVEGDRAFLCIFVGSKSSLYMLVGMEKLEEWKLREGQGYSVFEGQQDCQKSPGQRHRFCLPSEMRLRRMLPTRSRGIALQVVDEVAWDVVKDEEGGPSPLRKRIHSSTEDDLVLSPLLRPPSHKQHSRDEFEMHQVLIFGGALLIPSDLVLEVSLNLESRRDFINIYGPQGCESGGDWTRLKSPKEIGDRLIRAWNWRSGGGQDEGDDGTTLLEWKRKPGRPLPR